MVATDGGDNWAFATGQQVTGTAALHLLRIVLIWCRLKPYAVEHVWAVFAVIDISKISTIGGLSASTRNNKIQSIYQFINHLRKSIPKPELRMN